MGRLTFYDAVTTEELAEVEALAGAVLDSLGFPVARTASRDDGSRLLETASPAGETGPAVRLVPVRAGSFEPLAFDEDCTPELAASVRTICKVGGEESPDPRGPVQAALAVAAALGRGGRVYDMHALLAMSPGEAARIAQDSFDIKRYLTYHYLAPKDGGVEHSWIHLHGMGKFFCPDLEAFEVHPEVSHRALALLLDIAAELAAGGGPRDDAPRAHGRGAVRLRPSAEARAELAHFSGDDIDEHHEGEALVVEDAGALRSLSLLLRGAYELEPKSRAECEAERLVWQERLAAVREAWAARGDDDVVVRAGLALGPEGRTEHIWLEVQAWEGGSLRGRLLNDAFGDSSMCRGAAVTFDQARISGLAVFRAGELLSELEALRLVDPAAAASLDASLEPAPAPPEVSESTSPDGRLRARFEDDGRVGYLRLLENESGAAVCDPVWVYNRLPTPPLLDERCLAAGRLPLLSAVHTAQRDPAEAPSGARREIVWSEGAVMLLLDGEPWAVALASSPLGWSRTIEVASPYGRPWDEVEDQVGTVRAG